MLQMLVVAAVASSAPSSEPLQLASASALWPASALWFASAPPVASAALATSTASATQPAPEPQVASAALATRTFACQVASGPQPPSVPQVASAGSSAPTEDETAASRERHWQSCLTERSLCPASVGALLARAVTPATVHSLRSTSAAFSVRSLRSCRAHRQPRWSSLHAVACQQASSPWRSALCCSCRPAAAQRRQTACPPAPASRPLSLCWPGRSRHCTHPCYSQGRRHSQTWRRNQT